jgi:hypothetical protein
MRNTPPKLLAPFHNRTLLHRLNGAAQLKRTIERVTADTGRILPSGLKISKLFPAHCTNGDESGRIQGKSAVIRPTAPFLRESDS